MVPYPPHVVAWLHAEYSDRGPTACAKHLGDPYTIKGIRNWAYRRGLKWVRAGKPRPNDQSALMKRLWQEGKLVVPSKEVSQQRGKRFAEGLASGRLTHPRGMLGKTQTARCKAVSKQRAQELVDRGEHSFQRPRSQEQLKKHSAFMSARLKTKGAIYSNAKRGCRPDVGPMFFRSRWEANYARYLTRRVSNGEIISWEYEVDTFWFEKIRRGVRSYTPDFKITGLNGDVWYEEVKGWMDAKSKTKLKRMKKYYPSTIVIVIGEKEYIAIEKELGAFIQNWERKQSRL